MSSDIKRTYHPCQGWGCHERCIIEAYSKDGKIIRTQKAHMPGDKDHQREVCLRGVLNDRIPYTKDRLLYPLKRVGKRGEGKFERISWDQALDEIAEIMNRDIEKYGTRCVLTNSFFCGYPGAAFALQEDFIYRFSFGLDCSIIEYPAVDFGFVWAPTIDQGLFVPTTHEPLRKHQKMIVIWGQNPIGFTRMAYTSRDLLDMQESGTKLVQVSNMFDNTSAKVDEWVPVKSGTDAALALAMCHVIIEDGKVDEAFLLRETAAPYLVRDDNGKYLRESDVVEGGSPNKFVVMDKDGELMFVGRPEEQKQQAAAEKEADTSDFLAGGIPGGGVLEQLDGAVDMYGDFEPDLLATAEIAGTTCRTSYAKLIDYLEQWTPEYQETITGYPARECTRFAREIADATPWTLFLNCGLRYANSTQALRAIMLISYLTGNVGRLDGGTIVQSGQDEHPETMMNTSPIMMPSGWTPDKSCRVPVQDIIDSVDKPESQQYKVLLNTMGNILLNWPNKHLWQDKVFPAFDLIVDWEIRMTDTCRWSDYVLPETVALERSEVFSGQADVMVYCEPAIEPQGEAKDPAWIWSELSKRLGLPDDLFDMTQDEWARFKAIAGNGCMKTKDAEGNTVPFTGEDLIEKKIIALDLGPDSSDYDPLHNAVWGTDTGRLEFYNEVIAPTGHGFATYDPPVIRGPKSEKYPLQLYSGRHKYFMQGQFTNVPECVLLAKDQFGAAINPHEAEKRGMQDGDIVEVFNERGTMRVPLNIRTDIPDGMVHTWYSFDKTHYPDTCCPQDLQEPLNVKENAAEPMITWASHYVKHGMLDAGIPAAMCFIQANETSERLWDSCCDIRKVESDD